MPEVKLEDNIEIPFKGSANNNEYKETMLIMKVDQSFIYDITDNGIISSARTSMSRQSPNKKFISRKVNETTRRIWRIK